MKTLIYKYSMTKRREVYKALITLCAAKLWNVKWFLTNPGSGGSVPKRLKIVDWGVKPQY